MQSKPGPGPQAAKPQTDELKSRELTRHLPVCTFPECDWSPKDLLEKREAETKMRRESAIRAAADHAVQAGHVYVRAVKVRKVRRVVREEIVG